MVKGDPINPPALGPPIGYAHGMRVGDLIFIAGQIGADHIGNGKWKLASDRFAPQFEKALANVLEVVRAAGGDARSVVELTIFVKDMAAYRASRRELKESWKRFLGEYYPAITLVGVSDLYEAGALVEIRAVASVG